MLDGFKTYIGAGVALVATIGTLFGYTVSPEFHEQAAAIALDIVTIVGAGYAIYGRLVAKAPGWFAKQ